MRSLPRDPVRVPPMSDPAASARRPVVLLASAHEWAARSLPSILTPNGYRVLHAYAGHDALLQVRAAQPDVLMIDLQLPGIDGVALCRMLRADPSVTASTAIIATTPSPVGRQQRVEVRRAGGWGLGAPPLDAEEILLRIEWYVRAKRDADAARQDSLLDLPTALYNDRGLARRTRELGAQAERARAPVTCVVLTTGTEPVEVGTAGGRGGGVIARALGAGGRALVVGVLCFLQLVPLERIRIVPVRAPRLHVVQHGAEHAHGEAIEDAQLRGGELAIGDAGAEHEQQVRREGPEQVGVDARVERGAVHQHGVEAAAEIGEERAHGGRAEELGTGKPPRAARHKADARERRGPHDLVDGRLPRQHVGQPRFAGDGENAVQRAAADVTVDEDGAQAGVRQP